MAYNRIARYLGQEPTGERLVYVPGLDLDELAPELQQHAGVRAAWDSVVRVCENAPEEPPSDKNVAWIDPRDPTRTIHHTTWGEIPLAVRNIIMGDSAQRCADARDRFELTVRGTIQAIQGQRDQYEADRETMTREEAERVAEEQRRHEEERQQLIAELEEERRRLEEEARQRLEEAAARRDAEVARWREGEEARLAEIRRQADEETRRMQEAIQRVQGQSMEAQAQLVRQLQEAQAARLEALRRQAEAERAATAAKIAQENAKVEAQAQAEAEALAAHDALQAGIFGGALPPWAPWAAAGALGLVLLVNALGGGRAPAYGPPVYR